MDVTIIISYFDGSNNNFADCTVYIIITLGLSTSSYNLNFYKQELPGKVGFYTISDCLVFWINPLIPDLKISGIGSITINRDVYNL